MSSALLSFDPELTNENFQLKRKMNELDGIMGKRPRVNETCSKVVHLLSLPSDFTESEAANLAVPFGQIANLLVTRHGRALIEFVDENSAMKFLHYYTTYNPPAIRGQKPFNVQFSKHESLVVSARREVTDVIMTSNNLSASLSNAVVIRVQIEQPPPMSIGFAPFYKAFHQFGEIVRIISFKAGSQPQALIEFAESVCAHVAKMQMAGVPFLVGGFCRTEYSHQTQLEVHQENQYCRDFTKKPFAEVEDPFMHPQPMMRLPTASELSELDPISLANFSGVVIQSIVMSMARNPGAESHLLQNQMMSLRQLLPAMHSSMPHPSHPPMDHKPLPPPPPPPHGGMNMNDSCVLIVSQLNPDLITPDILFTLFGIYGDVQRVKIMYNKKHTALVQFSDANQANLAMHHLNDVPLLGTKIRCNRSRHLSINPSHMRNTDGENGEDLTKDYTGHRMHRFKNSNSRNFLNICPPNTVLHVSNLPEKITEEELSWELADASGHKIIQAKLNDKRMALVEFENLALAIEAITTLDGYSFKGKTRIRVTFSKMPIRPATV